MKICSVCCERPARLRLNGNSAGYCSECNKTKQKQHYRRNRGDYKSKARKYKRARLAFLWEIKLSNPCADCGGNYHPIAMDFDHVSGKKSFNIGQSGREVGVARLFEEIEKCELVCANCHRLRTLNRKEK